MVIKCKYTKYCGGCQGVNDDYAKSVTDKQSSCNKIFEPIGTPENIVTNFFPYKYRNKLTLAFAELKGKTLIGFFEEGSIKVTDIDGCILNGDWAGILIGILREYISRFKLRPYGANGGILRYAHARCVDSKIQLTLCVTTDNFAGRSWLYNKLKQNFNDVSFYLNINKRTDRAVFDKNFKFEYGNKYLTFDFAGVHVSICPSSFLQVNLPIAEKMYKKAIEFLDIKDSTQVIDLYSGVGITSIMFCRVAKKVIAIEENQNAVSNAKHMAKINNAGNIEFWAGKCEDMLDKMKPADDLVVFVDPARMGIEKGVLDRIISLNPRKIVYMSCNPETCVRDIKYILNDNNYQVSAIKPYDMFPFTKHIESLVCLQRQV